MGSSELVSATNGKGRRDVVLYDPEDLIVPTDKDHLFYDRRGEEAPDEALVADIMTHGVLEPVLVRVLPGSRTGGDSRDVEILAGRRRTIANREANRRLKAAGKEPHTIPAIVKRGTDLELFAVFVSENVHRKDATPLARAELMKRMQVLGATEEQLQTTFGLTAPAVRYTLAINDCVPAVKKAVAQGKIGAVLAAKELSKLAPEEQAPALEKLIESGVTKGEGAKEAVREMRKNGKHAAPPAKKKMRSRLVLERFKKSLSKVESREAKIAKAVVAYMLGNDRALAPYPKLVEALS